MKIKDNTLKQLYTRAESDTHAKQNLVEQYYAQLKGLLLQLGQKPLLPSVKVRSGLPRLYFRSLLPAQQKNVLTRFYDRIASYF